MEFPLIKNRLCFKQIPIKIISDKICNKKMISNKTKNNDKSNFLSFGRLKWIEISLQNIKNWKDNFKVKTIKYFYIVKLKIVKILAYLKVGTLDWKFCMSLRHIYCVRISFAFIHFVVKKKTHVF